MRFIYYWQAYNQFQLKRYQVSPFLSFISQPLNLSTWEFLVPSLLQLTWILLNRSYVLRWQSETSIPLFMKFRISETCWEVLSSLTVRMCLHLWPETSGSDLSTCASSPFAIESPSFSQIQDPTFELMFKGISVIDINSLSRMWSNSQNKANI